MTMFERSPSGLFRAGYGWCDRRGAFETRARSTRAGDYQDRNFWAAERATRCSDLKAGSDARATVDETN
ncbi:MAG: hypothetical protein RJA70_2754 [Pseudomonadota bacterium]|jgi:hypothetical protein